MGFIRKVRGVDARTASSMSAIEVSLAHNRSAPWSFSDESIGAALLFAISLMFFMSVINRLPVTGDWHYFYQAATHLSDPYQVEGFYNPVWMAWIVHPFTWLPQKLAFTLWITCSTFIIILAVRRMGGSIGAVLLVLLSPAYIRFITAGQMDAVPLLGFILLRKESRPAVKGLGAILMAAKPQTLGLGLIAYWLLQAPKLKLKLLMVPVAILVLSLLFYGFWPTRLMLSTVNGLVDCSPWPSGIPIGLAMFVVAIRKKQTKLAALSTYFLTPYLAPYSLVAYFAVLFSMIPIWMALAIDALLWIYVA